MDKTPTASAFHLAWYLPHIGLEKHLPELGGAV